MKSHETRLADVTLGPYVDDIKPVVQAGGSDTASLDSVFELLVRAGRDAPMAKALMIPPSIGSGATMKKAHRDLFLYCNAVMEPWDGPAAVAATDGTMTTANRFQRVLPNVWDILVWSSFSDVHLRPCPGRVLAWDGEKSYVLGKESADCRKYRSARPRLWDAGRLFKRTGSTGDHPRATTTGRDGCAAEGGQASPSSEDPPALKEPTGAGTCPVGIPPPPSGRLPDGWETDRACPIVLETCPGHKWFITEE
jgi:hypothetical protein